MIVRPTLFLAINNHKQIVNQSKIVTIEIVVLQVAGLVVKSWCNILELSRGAQENNMGLWIKLNKPLIIANISAVLPYRHTHSKTWNSQKGFTIQVCEVVPPRAR